TSSLPDGLLQLLEEKAKELALPKNKLIEQALRLYLDHLNRAAYIRSYKQMAEDTDLISIAEEGMADYYEQLENEAR
ncbi:MAG TPA: ribbon-helix-helix protein, CopG family, partial [Daejeonella sp.]